MTNFDKLVAKLSELFELEKADLDFGIHRIIKARQKHIRIFLGLEKPPANDPGAPTLQKIVQREMGELNTVDAERQLEAATAKIRSDYGKLAFDESGNLADGQAKESADGQQWLILHEQLNTDSVAANLQLEAEIYSHLTEFFSRYYDEADFLSKRRIKAGDAPYAVPYSGEEVMLHWANKDQYYIKSSKDLKDYTFTLPERFGAKRVQFKCERQDPVLNNNNAKREFHLDEEAEIQVGADHLVIPFHFKIVDKTRTQPETKKWIEDILAKLPLEWQQALTHTPEGAKNNLITRHLSNYTRKNESDFFIHKHLGKFLRGELDFYIKNEVMHLDDIDSKSTDYLATRVRLIKALRTIARHIITFLAQLENFQKKLWLKKKYVTETQYCITLDRIFAAEDGDALIATVLEHLETKIRRYDGEMRSQRDEWIKLYSIDELTDYPKDGPLTEAFLRNHDKMMVDTVFFPPSFKWKLLGGIEDLDSSLDGLIVHSENFQALNLIEERYREKVKCVYIDPPYNTGGDGFAYKDAYQRSSWITMISDRLSIINKMVGEQGVLYSSIDEGERSHLEFALKNTFGAANRVEEIIWAQNTTKNQSPTYSTNHEYIEVFAKNLAGTKSDYTMFRELKAGFTEIVELTSTLETTYPSVSEIEFELKKLFKRHKVNLKSNNIENDEWKGIYNYNRAEYRDASGKFVPEGKAKEEKAKIWIWREVDTSMPQVKEDSQKAEFRDPHSPTFRFYRPTHPITQKECPAPKRGWSWPYAPHGNQANCFRDLAADDRIAWGDDENKIPQRKSFLHEVESNVAKSVLIDFTDGEKELERLFGRSRVFGGPKPTTLAQRFCDHASLNDSFFCDFFAGSGTSGESVISYNRHFERNAKYILIEMGEHFDTVLKPRIQKVAFSASWKEGKPTTPKTGISHAFKYLRLESYEDALNNLDLGEDRAPDLLGLGEQVREDYLFSYLLDVETRGHLLNLKRFRDPWGCQLKIHDPHSGKSEPRVIDLVETFNYFLGVTVREVKRREGFLTIEGESPTGETILILWRKLEGESDWPATTNEELKTFVRDALRLNPADTEYHAIYLNGDHTLEDPHSKIHCIEEVFYERMFEHTGNPED